ncbi:3-methyl-2-oxobutanoate hydroxymethyltransferase [Corynebacterium yudongzhengii]|uniref:3-methyl-2-oxobutanoate hydroxymethyltransferase n=1 Tax=Corynebacterium yudongzhengii TaxID=2080740 RepID=A0A2U1T8H6_9CORY|nr:3-methyl-2-oxobutanoate hydroxymethyltransferase [Corynebacterium yudongzhengii]AWB81918.1 3-methyl-2-oxobutanoate hydroxymethyltransferase [Corynebacterium yudongzhengii]PWC02310.1 3-methyl-2-oxobutanoate hydroxymethyltransferase [Corynebacterium yudongzhengii]
MLNNLKRVRTRHLALAKNSSEPISMLTAYDALTARVFDEAGIDVLLVGDSAANVMLGLDSTLEITLDEIIMMARAVTRATRRALVVVDMPFGTYEASDEDAVRNAVRIMRETGAAAVKLEGARTSTIGRIVDAGIPVMGHLGFTPQSVHALGGHRVQGRDADAARLIEKARAVEAAGAFSLVVEMIPAAVGADVSAAVDIPVIGIGAGNGTDGQVLVWADAMGMSAHSPSFVRQYAALGDQLRQAAESYRNDVRERTFPSTQESFDH